MTKKETLPELAYKRGYHDGIMALKKELTKCLRIQYNDDTCNCPEEEARAIQRAKRKNKEASE